MKNSNQLLCVEIITLFAVGKNVMVNRRNPEHVILAKQKLFPLVSLFPGLMNCEAKILIARTYV